MALPKKRKNPKRSTRNIVDSYADPSEDSLVPPPLKYAPPKNKNTTHVKSIHFPELHHPENEYFIKVTYWYDSDKEYYPIKTACNKFIGKPTDENDPSLKDWLLEFEHTKYMTSNLWDAIQKAITVEVEPKYPIGSICMLIGDQLPGIISYVVILAHNSNNCCHFDDIDDLLLYLVQHIDLRKNSFKKFFKTTGKEFDLERPKGWVTENKLLCLTSIKYIGMTEVVWMEARLHYYKILSETLAQKSEAVKDLFMTTIKVLLDFIGIRVRGTLHLRNEGKIKSFTFHCAKPIMDSVLNKKFREVKKLKRNQKFKQLSGSTIYIFNHGQGETILNHYYCNRDFSEDGIEVFPENEEKSNEMDMDDASNEDESVLDYTMSFSALVFRFYRNAEKIVTKNDVIRLDHNNNMTGQQMSVWQSHKSKFDEKDFREIPIPTSDD